MKKIIVGMMLLGGVTMAGIPANAGSDNYNSSIKFVIGKIGVVNPAQGLKGLVPACEVWRTITTRGSRLAVQNYGEGKPILGYTGHNVEVTVDFGTQVDLTGAHYACFLRAFDGNKLGNSYESITVGSNESDRIAKATRCIPSTIKSLPKTNGGALVTGVCGVEGTF